MITCRGGTRFLDQLPNMYCGGIRFLPEENNGLDGSRTTGSTYAYIQTTLTIKSQIFIRKVLWDIANAATYTLTISGTSYGSIVVGGATTDVTWDVNLFVNCGGVNFRLTRSSNGQFRDANITSYDGTYFTIPQTTSYGGASYSYGSCLRLLYRPVVFATFHD